MANSGSAMAQKRNSPEEETAGGAAMCAKACGFFGAAATGGMCSKCYREHVATTAATTASVFVAGTADPSAPPGKKARTCVSSSVASPDAAAAAVDLSTAVEQPACAKPPTAAKRCLTCRKKVGLTGFRCRCEGTFCGVHRYSDKHHCAYDYKTAAREKIAKQNPVVVADKIVRI